MTPAEIIHGAAQDGIQLVISPNELIKARGEPVAVKKWAPLIREKKAGILRILTRPESDPDRQASAVTLEQLQPFQFDLAEQEMEGGFDSREIARVNNMAWEFMKFDGLSFDVAIRLAAEIVVSCGVVACEAAYEDVQALWRKLRCDSGLV